jgi:1-acyl-sn-glycerol-3-phosphate acyltransferase
MMRIMDLEKRDPDAIARTLNVFRPILSRVFRAKVDGFDRIPPGPHLFVANHSIGAVWEIALLLDAWEKAFGDTRPAYGLTHNMGLRLPWFRTVLPRIGAIPATHEAADEALISGASLIVFPGGNDEVVRPFWRRNRCELSGHKGFARIALRTGVPIVPVSIVGSHATNIVFGGSRLVSWLTIIGPLLKIRRLPVSVGQFLAAGVGFGVGYLFGPAWFAALLAWLAFTSPMAIFWPIFPARITALVGEPIDTAAVTKGLAGDAQIEALYEIVAARIQEGMDGLVRARGRNEGRSIRPAASR